MSHAPRTSDLIGIKHGSLGRLAPVVDVHWVRADELEEAETVVGVVGAGGGVGEEGLRCVVGVGELLGRFVGGEAVVGGAAVGGFFPGERGDGEGGALGEGGQCGPGVGYCEVCYLGLGRGGRGGLTLRDAQISGPGDVLVEPAAVDVVETRGVLEVRSIDGELVERVHLPFERVFGLPRIRSGALKHKHPMIHRWAGVVAHHIDLWRRGFRVRVGGEDDVPSRFDVVQLWGPETV